MLGGRTLAVWPRSFYRCGPRFGACGPVSQRFEDLGQEIGLRLVANHGEIAWAVGVVEHNRAEFFALQKEQFDLPQSDALGQCIVEPLWAEFLAVDADHGHSGGESSPVADHSRDDVADLSFRAEA